VKPIQNLQNIKKNSVATIIKSVLYDNNLKAFVCYINNDNNCACLSFDLKNNNWNDCEYKFLNDCNNPSFFSFEYFQNLDEYILNCFSSESKNNLILFNSNMELPQFNNNLFCVSEVEINSCQTNSISSVINYKNNGYKLDIRCSNSNNNNLEEIQLVFERDNKKKTISLS